MTGTPVLKSINLLDLLHNAPNKISF